MAENKDLSTIRGPFRVYEKPKKKEPISTVDEYQEAFLKSLEAYELSQRKVLFGENFDCTIDEYIGKTKNAKVKYEEWHAYIANGQPKDYDGKTK